MRTAGSATGVKRKEDGTKGVDAKNEMGKEEDGGKGNGGIEGTGVQEAPDRGYRRKKRGKSSCS